MYQYIEADLFRGPSTRRSCSKLRFSEACHPCALSPLPSSGPLSCQTITICWLWLLAGSRLLAPHWGVGLRGLSGAKLTPANCHPSLPPTVSFPRGSGVITPAELSGSGQHPQSTPPPPAAPKVVWRTSWGRGGEGRRCQAKGWLPGVCQGPLSPVLEGGASQREPLSESALFPAAALPWPNRAMS